MVSFNKENIPEGINTVEGLATWAIAILRHVHPTQAIAEQLGDPPVLAATLSPFDVRSADETWNYSVHARAVGRVSIPLSEDYQTKPLWAATQELGDGGEAIPNQFL